MRDSQVGLEVLNTFFNNITMRVNRIEIGAKHGDLDILSI
jgi:hypothetical protein